MRRLARAASLAVSSVSLGIFAALAGAGATALADEPPSAAVPAASSPAVPLRAPREIVARDLHEETVHIEVTVRDLYGRQETRSIPVTIFRPSGPGPFPLLVMNHGRAVDSQRAEQKRQRFEDLSRYFVHKGFVVMLPTRVGYADTYGDFDPEATGACNARRFGPVADAVVAQVLATRDYARTLPFVDASHWIVAGQSMGGFTTVVTTGHHPEGLVAGINFAGGSGGNPELRPGNPCSPQAVGRLWHELAAGDKAPMLWLYWQNDLFWGPKIPVAWHDAWIAGGGQAEMHTFAPAGRNGHSGSQIDMDHWVPVVDAFLAKLGYTQPAMPVRPPPSGFAAVGDVGKVPIEASARAGVYRRFLAAPSPRAFAIGPHGHWAFAQGDWAIGKALGHCERSGEPCRLYAVDDDVVWTP